MTPRLVTEYREMTISFHFVKKVAGKTPRIGHSQVFYPLFRHARLWAEKSVRFGWPALLPQKLGGTSCPQNLGRGPPSTGRRRRHVSRPHPPRRGGGSSQPASLPSWSGSSLPLTTLAAGVISRRGIMTKEPEKKMETDEKGYSNKFQSPVSLSPEIT